MSQCIPRGAEVGERVRGGRGFCGEPAMHNGLFFSLAE